MKAAQFALDVLLVIIAHTLAEQRLSKKQCVRKVHTMISMDRHLAGVARRITTVRRVQRLVSTVKLENMQVEIMTQTTSDLASIAQQATTAPSAGVKNLALKGHTL